MGAPPIWRGGALPVDLQGGAVLQLEMQRMGKDATSSSHPQSAWSTPSSSSRSGSRTFSGRPTGRRATLPHPHPASTLGHTTHPSAASFPLVASAPNPCRPWFPMELGAPLILHQRQPTDLSVVRKKLVRVLLLL
jgi:hypothetical protein